MKIESLVFIDDTNAKNLSDQDIFNKIAEAEEEVQKLSKIKTKPAKLQAKIDKLEATIQKLADYVDNRK